MLLVWFIACDAVMTTQGSYSLSCPTVAASGKVTVAVQHAGDHIVACDARQNRDRVDQLSRRLRAALTATTARQAQFGSTLTILSGTPAKLLKNE
jgi:hypothetical protein